MSEQRTLEEIAEIFAGNRPDRVQARPLTGKNSLLLRTLGRETPSEVASNGYAQRYFDDYRQAEADTEFHEFQDALTNYDSDPSKENTCELLMEFGDLYFQGISLKVLHKGNPEYSEVSSWIERAVNEARLELEERELSPDIGIEMTKIKYNIRAKNILEGKRDEEIKNKKLERSRAMKLLK